MKRKIALIVALSFLVTGAVSAASLWGSFKGNAIVKTTIGGTVFKPSGTPAIQFNGQPLIPLSVLDKAGIKYTYDKSKLTVDVKKPAAPAADPVTLAKEIIDNYGSGVTFMKDYGVMVAVSYLTQIDDYDSDWYYFDQIFQRLSKFNAQESRVVYVNADGEEIGTVSIESKAYRDFMSGKIKDADLQTKWIVTGKIGRTPLTPKEIGKLQNSVGVVLTYDDSGNPIAQGSGFVIRDNLFITNHHVVDGAKKITIKLDGVTYDASNWYYFDNKDADLWGVLLSTSYDAQGRPTGSSPAYSLDYDTAIPQIGEKVYAIGSPVGLENSLSEGIVSSIRTDNGMTLIQHTADIDHGSSGGVLLNEFGDAIGVTSSGVEGSNLEFAIPMKYVQKEVDIVEK